MSVSEIGFGAWGIAGVIRYEGQVVRPGWGDVDDQESVLAIHRAEDLGVNFIDTAPVYGGGHSEELIGQALVGRRDRWIIATKVGWRPSPEGVAPIEWSPETIRQECEASLRRLRTDFIDVYQVHSPPFEVYEKHDPLATLVELKQEGKIRAVGWSPSGRIDIFWSPRAVQEALRLVEDERIECLQIHYNILEPEMGALFASARDRGVGLIIRGGLMMGVLTGKYSRSSKWGDNDIRSFWSRERVNELFDRLEQVHFITDLGKRPLAEAALKFILAHDAVSTIIAGTKTVAQAEANAAVSEAPDLPAEIIRRAEELVKGWGE